MNAHGYGGYPYNDPLVPEYAAGQVLYVRTVFLPNAGRQWEQPVELAKIIQVFVGGHMFPRYRVRLTGGQMVGAEFTVTGTALTSRRPRVTGAPTPTLAPSSRPLSSPTLRPVLRTSVSPETSTERSRRIAVTVPVRPAPPRARGWLRLPWWLGGEPEIRRRS